MNTKMILISLSLLFPACSDRKFSGAPAQGSANQKAATVSGEASKTNPSGKNQTVGGETSGPSENGKNPNPIAPPTTKDGVTNGPTGKTIVFGGSGVYHVGDGFFPQSSCKATVMEFDLKGTSYHFLFTVEQDDTTVNFEVAQLCGVDGPMNAFTIETYPERTSISSAYLPFPPVSDKDPAIKPIASDVVLKKGKYAIGIYGGVGLNPTDIDDFIIGNIRVKADKPIHGSEIISL